MYEKLKQRLMDGGAWFVGTSYQEDTPFPGLHYCVSYGVRLSDAVVDTIDEGGPSKTYFHHYRTVNALLDNLGLTAVIFLQKAGFNAANIPASQSTAGYHGLFSHKKGAVDAGLGWIGKNALFISRETGPCVRLATVFTDMELPLTEHEYVCGCVDCRVCADKCPAGAVGEVNWSKDMTAGEFFDAEKCSQHMKAAYQQIGRGAVCGICMRYCPMRKKIRTNV